MNEIIGLRGKGNSGKSTTIRILYDLLLQNDFNIIRTNFNNNGGDFSAIFSKKDIHIGITSAGDTYKIVHNRLQDLIRDECNICVCACRTYDRIPPGTNDAIYEFSSYKNQFINKTVDNNVLTQKSSNKNDANNIISIINSFL